MSKQKGEFLFKSILLDIEGTTTSISFVKDVLFSYAADNIEKYLYENYAEFKSKFPHVVEDLVKLSNDQADLDPQIKPIEYFCKNSESDSRSPPEWTGLLAQNVRTWIAQDKKLTALKTLQGAMWEDAYRSGTVKAHFFADVLPWLKRWHSAQIPIYIFSSGSMHAQKLLFQHSEYGDLTPYLSGYFDTTVGAKVEIDSYRKIAEKIGKTQEILFVTDVDKEAFAADSAGLQVAISLRDGNAPVSDATRAKFKCIHSFDEIGVGS